MSCRLLMSIVAIALLSIAHRDAAAQPSPDTHTFEIEEHLGFAWSEQVMHRHLSFDKPGAFEPGSPFASSLSFTVNGEHTAFQIDNARYYDDGSLQSADLWFHMDLPAHAKRTCVLSSNEPSLPPTDLAKLPKLKADADGNTLVIDNGLTAVRLPAGSWQAPAEGDAGAALAQHLGVDVPAGESPGPILGVRTASGKWTAASTIKPFEKFEYHIGLIQPIDPTEPAGRLLGYETKLFKQGAIFMRARVTFSFEDGEYVTDVTLRDREPLVRIDERFTNAGAVTFDLSGHEQPKRLVGHAFRSGLEGQTVALDYSEAKQAAMFVGWNLYFAHIHAEIALSGEGDDVVGLMSTDPDWLPFPYNHALHVWTQPAESGRAARLIAKGSLAKGHRHWAVFAGRKSELDPLPERFVTWWYRNVAVPLDKVANWQLVWPGMDDVAFPHTFVSMDEVKAARETLAAHADAVTGLQDSSYDADSNRGARFILDGNIEHLKKLRGEGRFAPFLDHAATSYAMKAGILSEHYMNPMQNTDDVLKRLAGWEFVLGTDLLSKEERRDFLTRLAFFCYIMHDPWWIPPNYPFEPQKTDEPYAAYVQGTPNQKHCYVSMKGIVPCVLEGHPMRERWIEDTLVEYDRILVGSVAPSGVHSESPFYSSRDTMRFGPFMNAMQRAGVEHPLLDKWYAREKQCFRYLLDMLTPPEPRFGGKRVYHAVGRSSTGVIDPTFIAGADPFARDDPAFGRKLRWAWEQQGRPSPAIVGTTGGRDMTLTTLALAELLRHEPADEPPVQSRRWEGFGAILRSSAGTDHESNVLFRHDPFCWDLYETNNGAVYFHGKGAPLLPRFGGYWFGKPNLMNIPFGNRVVFASGNDDAEWTNALGMMTRAVLLGDIADYAIGQTRRGDWARRVLFVKDADADDPVYLLVRDDVSRADSASAVHWWVASKAAAPDGFNAPGAVPYRGPNEGWEAKLGSNWADAPKLTGQHHVFEGQTSVGVEMFIASPQEPTIVSDAISVGPRLAYAANPSFHDSQQLVRIEQPAPEKGGSRRTLTLLTPRLASSKESDPPRSYATIADGDGVHVNGPRGDDYMFLGGTKRIAFKDEQVSVNAVAAFARVGDPVRVRLMVVDGEISAAGMTLSSKDAAALVLEDGKCRVVVQGRADAARVRFDDRIKQPDVTIELVHE